MSNFRLDQIRKYANIKGKLFTSIHSSTYFYYYYTGRADSRCRVQLYVGARFKKNFSYVISKTYSLIISIISFFLINNG